MQEGTVSSTEEVYTPVMENSLLDALTAKDRCDGCGAQAFAYAELPGGGEPLLFCIHHANQHRDALEAGGARVFVKELVGNS